MTERCAPVITIDGPSGVGKGTISLMLAKHLHWHFLDSGAIYRAIAWAVLHYQVPLHDTQAIERLVKRIQIRLGSLPLEETVTCDGYDITQAIRSEQCSAVASVTSELPMVRQAVLQYQRDFRRWPGLIADGRDMGTVVFPEAPLKFFFTADSEERVLRRYKQLQDKGINVSLPDIRTDLKERDSRDTGRAISPAKPAKDAIVVDTTHLSIDQVFQEVMRYVKGRMFAE